MLTLTDAQLHIVITAAGRLSVARRGCREPAFDKSGGLFPIIDEGHGERLVANKFSVEKSIEQYHREDNERPTGCKIVSLPPD